MGIKIAMTGLVFAFVFGLIAYGVVSTDTKHSKTISLILVAGFFAGMVAMLVGLLMAIWL